MQVELLNRKRWKTRIELTTAIHDYIELFQNTSLRHSALGMLTPTEYETLHAPTRKPPDSRTSTPRNSGQIEVSAKPRALQTSAGASIGLSSLGSMKGARAIRAT